MNKKIIFIIATLLVSSVFGALITGNFFEDKTSMIDYFKTYKETRENDIKKILINVEITTDKLCKIEYNTEHVDCTICYKYTLNDQEFKRCETFPEDTDVNNDFEKIKEIVKIHYTVLNPVETIGYTKDLIKGTVLEINKETSTEPIISP